MRILYKRRAEQHGFSLVEMIIALAIVAISLAIGIPQIASAMQRSSATATVNTLVAALNKARFEAARRGQHVVLQSTSGGNDWSSGWGVYADTSGDGTFNELVTQDKPGSQAVGVVANNVRVEFNPVAAVQQPLGFSILVCDARSKAVLRTIQVAASGTVSNWVPASSGKCP